MNGVFEPNEPLRVRFQARNFSDGQLASKDLTIQIEALDSTSAVIAEGQSPLVQGLRAKSVTDVLNAFDFHVNEAQVGHVARFRFVLFYQGKNCGEQVLEFTPEFAASTQLSGPITLAEDTQAYCPYGH